MNTKIFGIFLLLIVGTLTIKFIPQENLGFELMNHDEGDDTDPEAKLAQDKLKAFLTKNKDILKAIRSKKRLTASQSNKLLKFILDDPVYSSFMIKDLTSKKENAWMQSLSPAAQKRAIKIIFKNLFSDPKFNFLNQNAKPSNKVISQIIKDYLKDTEIKTAFVNSLPWDQLKSDQEFQKKLIEVAPQFKDVDFGNLTQDQKLKILKLAATHPNLQQ